MFDNDQLYYLDLLNTTIHSETVSGSAFHVLLYLGQFWRNSGRG